MAASQPLRAPTTSEASRASPMMALTPFIASSSFLLSSLLTRATTSTPIPDSCLVISRPTPLLAPSTHTLLHFPSKSSRLRLPTWVRSLPRSRSCILRPETPALPRRSPTAAPWREQEMREMRRRTTACHAQSWKRQVNLHPAARGFKSTGARRVMASAGQITAIDWPTGWRSTSFPQVLRSGDSLL
jgi:hypothetical protein